MLPDGCGLDCVTQVSAFQPFSRRQRTAPQLLAFFVVSGGRLTTAEIPEGNSASLFLLPEDAIPLL